MDTKTYQKAATLITACLPNLKLEFDIYFELLRDLPDEPFLKAVADFCRNETELFPGSNLVALLRQRTRVVMNQPKPFARLTEHVESDRHKNPPPPEFTGLFKRKEPAAK